MTDNRQAVKNILVLRNDRFGEFLLIIPALRSLKETFPGARITAVVDPYVRELAESIVFIDDIMQWRREKHPLSEKLKLIGMLRGKNIDIAVMLNPSQEFNIITYFAGIPVRVGYARKWGFLLNHRMKDKKYLGLKHEIEYNLELVSLIGAKTEDKSLSLKTDSSAISDLVKEHGLSAGDNLIAIHPYTSDPLKQWPLDKFLELASKLSADAKVMIIGGKENLEKVSGLFDSLKNSGVINLTARTALKQLASLLKICKLLISGDSGPVHLASCVGTPTLAIFRSDMPEKSSRRWGPLTQGSMVIEKNKLSDITVEEVLEKARSAMGRG